MSVIQEVLYSILYEGKTEVIRDIALTCNKTMDNVEAYDPSVYPETVPAQLRWTGKYWISYPRQQYNNYLNDTIRLSIHPEIVAGDTRGINKNSYYKYEYITPPRIGGEFLGIVVNGAKNAVLTLNANDVVCFRRNHTESTNTFIFEDSILLDLVMYTQFIIQIWSIEKIPGEQIPKISIKVRYTKDNLNLSQRQLLSIIQGNFDEFTRFKISSGICFLETRIKTKIVHLNEIPKSRSLEIARADENCSPEELLEKYCGGSRRGGTRR